MFRAFFLLIFGLAAGAVGYQAGLASAAASGTAGTVVVLGGGPGIGTFLFLLFLGFLVFGGFRRRAWAHGGHGPWGGHGPMGMGPGRWGGPSDPNDPRRQWVADMHRKLHEADAAAGTGGTPGA